MSEGVVKVRSVVMLTARFHPYQGGAERQALAVSKVLASRGIKVTVLTRRLRGLKAVENLGGIEVRRLFRLGGGILDAVTFMTSVFLHLLGRRYGVYHVHLASSPAVAAAAAARLTGRGILVKLGGGVGVGETARSSKTLLGRCKLWSLVRLGVRFVAVNTDQREELREFGADAAVLSNGVDLEVFRPPEAAERGKLRKTFGASGKLVFLFVGRLADDKGQMSVFSTVFDAWSKAMRGGLKAEFWIAGTGPQELRLRRMAADSGLSDRVRMMGAVQDPERLYRAVDVLVLPTRSEGVSNVLLEAMASGLPVLAAKVSGNIGLIEDGADGRLFDTGDADRLKELFLEVASDAEIRVRLGRAARKRAMRNFSIESTVDGWLKLYDECAQRGI